jgi:hypothetical protein
MTSEVGICWPAPAPKVRPLARLIVNVVPAVARMRGGCQAPVCAPPVSAVQGFAVASTESVPAEYVSTPPLTVPQRSPHIGTAWPSGSVAVVGDAVSVTVTSAVAAPLDRRARESANPALIRNELSSLERIWRSPVP